MHCSPQWYPKGSIVEQEGRKREQEAERAEMQMQSALSAKCPFHLKHPFAGCKAAPSGWSPTSRSSKTEHDWLQLTISYPSWSLVSHQQQSLSLPTSHKHPQSTTAGSREKKNGPKLSQGRGGKFNYWALTRLLSVCLSLEEPSWAQGSPKVSVHTSRPWRATEAGSQQVNAMKNRGGGVKKQTGGWERSWKTGWD